MQLLFFSFTLTTVTRQWRLSILRSRTQSFSTNFNSTGGTVVASLQASEIPQDQLLVFLYPGLPTTAELFILPDERTSGLRKKSNEETLETVRVKMR